MDVNKSYFFDLLRSISSCLVLLGHIPMVLYSFNDEVNLNKFILFISSFAHPAVIVFFVLSGYLISYTCDRKKKIDGYGLKEFNIDRISRIYSVIFFSIILTILLDFIGKHFYSEYSEQIIVPQDNYIFRLFINFFCLQGIWEHRIQFGSNPALWSIGYEFCFYVLYGFIFYKIFPKSKDYKLYIVLLFLLLLFRGFPLIIYFGIWIFGVLAYYLSQKIKIQLPYYFVLINTGLILLFTYLIYNKVSFHESEIIKDVIFSFLIFIIFIPNYDITKNYNGGLWRINEYFSSSSFSLYAYHLPIIYLLSAFTSNIRLFNNLNFNLAYLFLIVITYIICYMLYFLTERRREGFKKYIIRMHSLIYNLLLKGKDVIFKK